MSDRFRGSYRELATRPVLTWAAVAVATRLPVAMAPLAVVLLVRERPGGYGLGAVLAAAYVLGEVVGAAVLGPRLRPRRARRQLAAGLAAGAAAFSGLGLLPGAHPVVLGALGALAGAAPAAAPGGLRVLLTSQLPERLAAPALSAESTLTFAIWAAAPALATVFALQLAAYAPLLLAAALMLASAVALRALPAGWDADESDRQGASMLRTVARAWPVYVTGAAALALLALAELVLPALLVQRGIALGWAGPLLAGFSVASAAGAFLYGLRGWPGRLRTQSLVLLVAVAACVAATAVVPVLPGIALALALAGFFESGVQITRNLSLREALPPSAVAAGYSVLYAAVGLGYAGSAVLSGAVLAVAGASNAMLAGVGLTLVLTVISAVGEKGRAGVTIERPAIGRRDTSAPDHPPLAG